MEKSKKINLSTVFLILAIIVIIIIGYSLYKTFNERTLLTQKNVNLESEISSLKIEENHNLSTTSNTELSSNSISTDNTSTLTSLTEAKALEIATNLYETAYQFILSEEVMTYGNYKVDGMEFSYKVNITKLEKLFSKKAITNVKGQLYNDNGQYYDADDERNYTFSDSIGVTSIFSSTDSGIRPLSIIAYNDEYIVATGKLEADDINSGDEFPLYIIFKKENGNWLIDLYE